MMRVLCCGLVVIIRFYACQCGEPAAQEVREAKPSGKEKKEAGPPIPIHGVEGTGGILFTQSAYLVNAPGKGKAVGLPSLSATYLNLGNDRHLASAAVTETFLDRLEIGYAYANMSTGDFNEKVKEATTLRISDQRVELHNFNLRGVVVKDGGFAHEWMPQISAGVQFKYNPTIDDVNRDLRGTLRSIGVKDNFGVDFTFYVSKLVTKGVPRPILFDAGMRATRAAHIGFLGFTEDYNAMAEGNFGILAHKHLLIGMEYRMKPNEYKKLPGLLKAEDDWWGAYAAYLPNEHISLSVGYGHFGGILNHQSNRAWGLQFKWEF